MTTIQRPSPVSRRKPVQLLCLCIVGLLCVFTALPAWAASDDDVLANSPVVRRNLQYRGGRHEISLLFGSSLGDPFVRNVMPGIRYNLHIFDWLALGVNAQKGIAYQTSMADQIQTKVEKNNALFTMEGSRINYLATAHLSVAPLTGKFMAFGSLPLAFDVHFNLLFGIAGVGGTLAIPDAISLAPGVGGGVRIFFSRIVAATFDLSDMFLNRTLAVDRNGQPPPPQYSANLLFTAGLSIILPPDLKRAD